LSDYAAVPVPQYDDTGERLLEVRDLKTYFRSPRGTVKAVDGVTFSLERGKTIGIVGESGSGKTVLSRSVMNILPKRAAIPAGGEVLFEGRDLRSLSSRQMREVWGQEIAMIFQDPMTSLNPVMKIGPQITESLRHHLDLGRRDARETAIALLDSVGIPAPARRMGEYPHQLSGGMRQRVTIAIALACGPKLLIADEPTTALDVTVQAQILDLLQKQQRERYMGLMLITHDLGVVAGRTDHIGVMYAGEIVEMAETYTLFTEKRHPYTEALLNSIPRIEYRSHTRLQAISGRPPDLVNVPTGCRFSARCLYAQPKCLDEHPPLIPSEQPGHEFRCWYPVDTPQGKEALERNRKAGATAAGTPMTVEVPA
jgi:peptide/nickel transport system ATP-binding protein